MLQQVSGLVEDFQTLRALKRTVLTHHALVLMRISQMGDVMATRTTLVSSLAPDMQRGLLRLCRMLLLVVLLTVMLLLLLLLLLLLGLLLLLLLLLQCRVWLEDDAVDGAAQCVRPWWDGVHHWRRGNSMLLPRLRHPGTCVRIQL